MRKPLTFFAVLSLFQLNAQTPYRLNFDYNGSSGLIVANGMFFKDEANNLPTYRPNKMGGVETIFQSSFSVSGKDVNGQDKMSITTYDGSDFTCGPIAMNYSDPNYVAKFGNIIWRVYQADIVQHIQNWNTSGYVVPASISIWPGNGDMSNGMAAQLAPYADVNGNGIYDPENGDYPEILGDAAMYLIMNDQNSTQFPATSPMNMELHYMFYQFATADVLNRTTFVNVKAYNRSTATYFDVKLNVFNDFDLGNYNDDLCGVDVPRNLAYVYNGDNNDEPFAGRPGFGTNPPAMGMVSLNHPLISSVFPGALILPNPNNEFLNVIDGKNPNGTAITNNGTPTVFQYSDTLSNGYNELALSNVPADRRLYSSVSLGTFAPNAVKCLDFAWVYARQLSGTSLLKSVDSLMKVADFVQDFYDNMDHCMDGMLQVESLEAERFSIYPNPSNGKISCAAGNNLESIEVWNMEGKLIRTIQTNEKEVDLDLSQLTAGVYLIKLSTASETKTMPFYKQ